jgi:hypothetical protein
VVDQMTITLTPEEWDRVLDVLGDGRFKVVSPLIVKILAQARAQNEAEQVEPNRPSPRIVPRDA